MGLLYSCEWTVSAQLFECDNIKCDEWMHQRDARRTVQARLPHVASERLHEVHCNRRLELYFVLMLAYALLVYVSSLFHACFVYLLSLIAVLEIAFYKKLLWLNAFSRYFGFNAFSNAILEYFYLLFK